MTSTMSHDYDLEANLQLDYNHLESTRCFCGKEKEPGTLFCRDCLEFMPVDDLLVLDAMKPGEGIVEIAQRAYTKLDRSKRKRY
jgi:hypothetical protein